MKKTVPLNLSRSRLLWRMPWLPKTSNRSLCNHNLNKLQLCIVGSGPAGFYTLEALLKRFPQHGQTKIQVHLYDKLPVPYGLVRMGVAPDHPEVKAVTHRWEKLIEGTGDTEGGGRVRFLGGVEIGKDLQFSELRQRYHAIIFAYGASSDRFLNIPGEDHPSVYSAREFVGWYNGEPMYSTRQFKLGERVAVIGQGNVALDVARILLRPVEELAQTDITSYALQALSSSPVKEVHIIGRRGPAQASFTNKELREILSLTGCSTVLHPPDVLHLNEASLQEAKNERAVKRMIELLMNTQKKVIDDEKKIAEMTSVGQVSTSSQPMATLRKKLHLHYLRSPVRLLPNTDGSLSLELEHNVLIGEAGKQKAIGTKQMHLLQCDTVFRSIGYKSVPIEGLPFDNDRGIVPNQAGRVLNLPLSPASGMPPAAARANAAGGEESAGGGRGGGGGGDFLCGVYVSGWLKRGPSGVIGTNRFDAEETVDCLYKDLKEGKLCSGTLPENVDSIDHLLHARRVDPFSWKDWKEIERVEEERGKKLGKEREKVTSFSEMAAICKKSS
jgi:adrenodoxin-NADP+ reductase